MIQLTAGAILEKTSAAATELRQTKDQVAAVHARANSTQELGARVLEHVLVSTQDRVR